MSDGHMPAAGWYPDPEEPTRLRWWDGSLWTDHRVTRNADLAPEGLRDVGSFISASFGAVTKAWKPLGVLCGIAIVPLVVAFLLADAQLGFSEWFGELLDVAATTPPGEDPVVPEWDVEVATAAIWGVAIAVLYFFSLVVLPLASIPLLDAATKDEDLDLDLDRSLRTGLKAAPRALGLGLLMTIVMMVPLVIGVLVIVAAPILALLVIPAGVALWAVVYVRFFVLFQPLLVLEGRGLSVFRRSWELTEGRFWGLLGRSLLFGLIVGVATNLASMPFSVLAALDSSLLGFSYAVSLAAGSVGAVIGAASPVILRRDLVDGPPVQTPPTVWGPPPSM